jgi:invasin-like protein/PKD domain-containing protein
MRRFAVSDPAVGRKLRTALLLAAGIAVLSCTADEVDIPDLYGPTSLAESLEIFANPDALVADGRSFSLIQGVLRDKNGQPIRGRAVLFKITDAEGREANIGTLSSDSGKGTVITDNNGIATAVYTAPPRADFTASHSVLIMGRVLGTDFNGELEKFVRIELRSAEPRLFPQNNANVAPKCAIVSEFPNGNRAPVAGLFQSASSDPDPGDTIVRYEWFFQDDGGRADSPDTGHIFRTPGRWSVFHTVTDRFGAMTTCSVLVNII